MGSKYFKMSLKRKEYKVGDRVKKAALFFLACEANPATRLSIPAAMRAKGYSDANDMDQILIQQVCHESQNNNLVRRQWPRLQCWLCLTRQMRWGRCLRGYHQLPIPEAFSVALGGAAGNLPTPHRKTRKTCHHEQIKKKNGQKQKPVHAQAHACATTLVAKER
jgi:hypothetical protein